MTCRDIAPDIVDYARGLPLDSRRLDRVTSHLQTCQSCAELADRERGVSLALRRLAESQTVPAANDVQLQKLLASFDAPRGRSKRIRVALEWSLAASVLIVAGLAVMWRPVPPPADTAATLSAPSMNAPSAFVVLPGADALPRFEHGQVIEVDIPTAAGVVRAEVLVGQDGLARAARLVQ